MVIPPKKREAAETVNFDGEDARDKYKFWKKGKLKKRATKGAAEKDGKGLPPSTVRQKMKRKFPSREEISQAR